MEDPSPRLDHLNELVAVLHNEHKRADRGASITLNAEGAGFTHCPTCGDHRRMDVEGIHLGPTKGPAIEDLKHVEHCTAASLPPSLLAFICRQCKHTFTAVIYKGPGGPSLAVFPDCYGGLRTPHTPQGVAYYLDQAHRARSVGANSAAVAMYRAALEHLLFQAGYTEGTCGTKLQKLDRHMEEDSDRRKKGLKEQAPPWAQNINRNLLTILKQLGDGSIHPNNGDIDGQKALDTGVLAAIEKVFVHLLNLVYERPHEDQAVQGVLESARDQLKKKP